MLGIGTAEVTGTDGAVRLYGYVPVNAATSNGLAVFVGRDRERIFADINRSIRLNGAVVLIGLLLSAAVAAFYIRRVLVRPLQSLLSVAGRWRDGDWTARTGAASGIPEFDRLSVAFDSMAAEVSVQIREREITEQTLAAGLERFRFIFESASDGIFVTDAHTHTFLDVNAAACAMFGYSQGELIGRTIEFLSTSIPPYGQHDVMALLEKGPSGGTQTFVWHCKAKDGHLFWAEISVRNVTLGGHEVAILRDITERKRQHEEVTRQAHFDTLTGLPNRLNFDATLEQEITRCRRYDRPLCMAIADIDHFKLVNDTFGHQVGDAVLKHLAEFMRKSLRTTDYVARWGGEEFTILLPETNLDDAGELLNRLRVGVSNHVIPEIGRAVTLSFGVTAGTKSDSPEDLLKRADRALYTSKQTGRNKVIKLRRSAADAHSAPVPL
jgi:diguanylate cyclase (GGDEF)-like protein/PAS domain S-box-containing protein